MCAPFGVCVCVVLYTLSRPKPMMAITHATISYCSLNLLKIRKKEVVRCSYFYFIFSSFFLANIWRRVCIGKVVRSVFLSSGDTIA